jgi:acyl carrier protein
MTREEIKAKILEAIREVSFYVGNDLTEESHFHNDLGMDSNFKT